MSSVPSGRGSGGSTGATGKSGSSGGGKGSANDGNAGGDTSDTGDTSDEGPGPIEVPPEMMTGPAEPLPTAVFTSAITNLTIEIDYMTNAAPYVGSVGLRPDVWQIFKDNIDELFAGTKTLTVPTQLSQMEELTGITDTEFTVQDILDIAAAHRQVQSGGAVASYYFVFLDGYFHNGVSKQTNVLGVSLGRTAVVAFFKPVIKSTANFLNPGVEKYVEQATVVHELGHAVGLVNNGLPMAAAHEDQAHGAHCTNTSCGMYYLNESPSALSTFVSGFLSGSSPHLFDSQCLADATQARMQ